MLSFQKEKIKLENDGLYFTSALAVEVSLCAPRMVTECSVWFWSVIGWFVSWRFRGQGMVELEQICQERVEETFARMRQQLKAQLQGKLDSLEAEYDAKISGSGRSSPLV